MTAFTTILKNPGKVSQFILLLSLLVSQVSDKDFSITINAYFNVKWRDPRLLVSKDYSKEGRHPEVFFVCYLSDVWSCFDVAMFPRAVLCSVAIIVCLRPLLQRAHKGPIPYKFLRKRLATYFLRIFTHSIFWQISRS